MAQVDSSNNPNDPNNPNNAPGAVVQPGQTNQPATTGGAGGVTTTGAGNVTGQVVGTANPSQPFQNISSYLAANAPQSKDLAGQVAGAVAAPITAAQSGIADAAGRFTDSVNKGFAPENKDLVSAVSQNPAYVVAENPDNVTNFLGQLNNKYTGPTDFTQEPGYADLQGKIAKAQSVAANTENEAGIQTLLQGVEGPTTAGINKLDSLLLSANPENTQTIKAAGAPVAGLQPLLSKTTADQNALAATGSKTAAQTAAAALAALNQAHGAESTNLTSEQNSIQDIVNQYNKSVGIINPVVQNITAAIQEFLANNPNVTLPSSGDPMADIRNLANIAMPELATYASPEDYAQIAALTQLGDANVGGLPIGSATASQAQSFKVPTALQDAVGHAPGVEAALSGEIGNFGQQINSAAQPFQDLVNKENVRADLRTQLDTVNATIKQLSKPNFTLTPEQQAQLDAANAQRADIMGKANAAGVADDLYGSYADSIRNMAQGLQWVNGTETSYQQLVDAINGQLGKLGQVGVPSLAYGPGAAAAPKIGAPIGLQKDVANAASIGVGAGIPVATGAGVLSASAPTTASALAAAAPGTVAGEVPAAGLTALQAAGPAALAAYGTSNIVQNSLKDPIRAGIMDLANTGLSLATLSLPPQIFSSIGKDISNVINSIGDFFGGLF